MRSCLSRFTTQWIAPVLLGLAFVGRVLAQNADAPPIPPPPALPSVESYVLMDVASGQVLASKNPENHYAPASLAKLMTAYLTYQALQGKTLTLDQQVPVTVSAWRTGGSRMFIQPRVPVDVDQLLSGLIIDSGNDAAVALSEAVAGSQGAFVGLMNQAAQRLGLTNTHYTNVDGLPSPGLYTSAMDVALLSKALITRFPQILKISVQRSYTYNKITQPSWNPVLARDPTVDGLKTGLTDEAGYCIDATALRNGRRLIAVVMHGPSWKGSTAAIEALLDYGSRFFTDHEIYRRGQTAGTYTSTDLEPLHLPVGPASTVVVAVPKGHYRDLRVRLVIQPPKGTIRRGQAIGSIEFTIHGRMIQSVPAVALRPARRANVVEEFWNRMRLAV
ncbi:MAG: D-alanyl-D-alanine carboxypeptidase family protein [Acidiferrobacteraceae bacterium]